MEKWDINIDQIKADLLKDIELLNGYLKETIEQYGTGEDDETENKIITGKN